MYGDDDNEVDDNEAQVDGGDIREIKIHVYDTRQTANVSWEFLRIENKQLKTVQTERFFWIKLGLNYLFLCRSNKQ